MTILDRLTKEKIIGYCVAHFHKGDAVPPRRMLRKLGLDKNRNFFGKAVDKELVLLSLACIENPDADSRLFTIGSRYVILEDGVK